MVRERYGTKTEARKKSRDAGFRGICMIGLYPHQLASTLPFHMFLPIRISGIHLPLAMLAMTRTVAIIASIGAAALLALTGCASTGAPAGPPPDRITGHWYGVLWCSGENLQVTTYLTAAGSSSVVGLVSFYPYDDSGPTGRFKAEGSFDGGQLVLEPTDWTKASEDLDLFGISGTVTPTEGYMIVQTDNQKCGKLGLAREGSEMALQRAAEDMVRKQAELAAQAAERARRNQVERISRSEDRASEDPSEPETAVPESPKTFADSIRLMLGEVRDTLTEVCVDGSFPVERDPYETTDEFEGRQINARFETLQGVVSDWLGEPQDFYRSGTVRVPRWTLDLELTSTAPRAKFEYDVDRQELRGTLRVPGDTLSPRWIDVAEDVNSLYPDRTTGYRLEESRGVLPALDFRVDLPRDRAREMDIVNADEVRGRLVGKWLFAAECDGKASVNATDISSFELYVDGEQIWRWTR